MQANTSRDELRKAIAVKGDEAQQEFSKVVIFYDKECYPTLKTLRQSGLIATAYELELHYNMFVEEYYMKRSMIPEVHFYTSRKQLLSIQGSWRVFIATLISWKRILEEAANPERERLLREANMSHVSRIKNFNRHINEIVGVRITEIRAEEPNTLSSLALIPTAKKFFEPLLSGENFQELEANNKILKDLECRASKMCESLSARYE